MATPLELNRYLGLLPATKEKPLTKLSVRDRQVLLAALEGSSPQEIVDNLSVPASKVRRILSSPTAEKVFEDFLNFRDREFEGLYGLSIDAVRKCLRAPDLELALKAASLFIREHKARRGAPADQTAEDVVRRIMTLQVVEERRLGRRSSTSAPVRNSYTRSLEDAGFESEEEGG